MRSIVSRVAPAVAIVFALAGCGKERAAGAKPDAQRPSILLVTLDTTRFDAVGPDARGVRTPAYDALVKRGVRFMNAYAAVPQTLPSHTSMLTGLYAGGHGIHENGRYLADTTPLAAEKLKAAGYHTAAFVSAFALARRFGLARGFETYDDEMPAGREERKAAETTDRALAWIANAPAGPLFVWVHYYDPHYPYTPPEPFVTTYAKQPYYGEIAYMDQQLGRLVAGVEGRLHTPLAIIVAGDHGEGLGDHGEAQHGDLLYQSTTHVPLLLIAPGTTPSASTASVSTRRIFHTILDLAGIATAESLRASSQEVVAGEAMKPYLDYGWQPQVMAIDGRTKAILAGKVEVYDLASDPGETRDLGATSGVPRTLRATLQQYPVPTPEEAAKAAANVTDEDKRRLASLGYIASDVKPAIRKDAPRPADMAFLFPTLDDAAARFARGDYAGSIPLLETILSKDPHNLDAALRVATAYSSLGRYAEAEAAFHRAEQISPESQDVKTYHGLHYVRRGDWPRAAALLEQVVEQAPDRLPAVEGLAVVRERQGRIDDAVRIRQKIYGMRSPSAAELVQLGAMQMSIGDTNGATVSFERARSLAPADFHHDLELGVLYLAAHRFEEARAALDRVPTGSPEYAMALFKRAQVSVLLREPDAASRIAAARAHADATTRGLIEHERLFAGQ